MIYTRQKIRKIWIFFVEKSEIFVFFSSKIRRFLKISKNKDAKISGYWEHHQEVMRCQLFYTSIYIWYWRIMPSNEKKVCAHIRHIWLFWSKKALL